MPSSSPSPPSVLGLLVQSLAPAPGPDHRRPHPRARYHGDQLDRHDRPLRRAPGPTVLFEAAILFAMVGFISTVAYCKFVLRGDIIE
jgi:hypothetical protein